jgi:hypothetical protein
MRQLHDNRVRGMSLSVYSEVDGCGSSLVACETLQMTAKSINERRKRKCRNMVWPEGGGGGDSRTSSVVSCSRDEHGQWTG